MNPPISACHLMSMRSDSTTKALHSIIGNAHILVVLDAVRAK